ncbi:MAG: carboxypeptidase regulatory-like domain-containing protein [Planctomycetes bacterium]|nr:carboxypeptidase regulatory-like domain-containing protein [Planctomycetota bacterium]
MGRIVALLAVLLVLAGAGVWLLSSGERAPDAPGAPAKPSPAETLPTGAAAPAPAPVPGSGTLVSTAEQHAEARPARDLAPSPTVFLQVFDRVSTQPVAGAAVHRYHGGDLIDFTDRDGRCALPLAKEEQLAVVADDYLLRLCPVRPGSSADAPQRVLLERDAFSLRGRFQFRRPDGARIETVIVRLQSQNKNAGAAAQPRKLAIAGPEVQRAWLEHTMIASLQPFGHLHVQLGLRATAQRHILRGNDEVRFGEGGLYEFEAATMEGLVARGVFQVESIVDEPLLVTMEAGRFVSGIVLAADGKTPCQGAQITTANGDPLQLLATTGADGAFRIGPLGGGVLTLEVRHRDHEILLHGPIPTDSAAARIVLQALPTDTLRGRVRARPGQRPIGGATVSVMDPTGQPVTAQSDADGWFRLRLSAKETARLAIAAPGFLPYAELIEPGALSAADFDLWPANTGVRLAEKMTALLRGIVVDARGRPLAGVPVRWQAAAAAPPVGIPGRRVIDGGVLALSSIATTGNDGSFEIETLQAGAGVVFPVDGVSTEQDGLRIDIALGQTRDGLRLEARQRP